MSLVQISDDNYLITEIILNRKASLLFPFYFCIIEFKTPYKNETPVKGEKLAREFYLYRISLCHLFQVNGKSYPQAKLLLGQMGALHPANRLAAYITGRLRPSVLDLSTLSTVISKVASNAKVAASRKPRTLLPSTSNSKMASSGPATNRSGKNQKAFVPAKRPIGKWFGKACNLVFASDYSMKVISREIQNLALLHLMSLLKYF